MAKVLVVDDEEYIVEIIEEVLVEDMEFEVQTANNGQEGLENALNEKYDLICSDVRMPKLKGHEFVGQVRGGDGPNKDTPILFISAFSDPAKSALKEEPNIYFVDKPLMVDRLIQSINAALGEG
jgi:CheY-like chemotaxis protein